MKINLVCLELLEMIVDTTEAVDGDSDMVQYHITQGRRILRDTSNNSKHLQHEQHNCTEVAAIL